MGDARLGRDARRVPLHRNRRCGGDSEGRRIRGGIGPTVDVEALSYGVGGSFVRSWRVAPLALITGNGSGPDGNSLTVDYLRSKGAGLSLRLDHLCRTERPPSWPSTYFFLGQFTQIVTAGNGSPAWQLFSIRKYNALTVWV